MPKWEYAVLTWDGSGTGDTRCVNFTSDYDDWVPIKKNRHMDTLERLGEEEWEMVGVEGDNTGYPENPEHIEVYFKRPKQEADAE